MQNRDQPFPLYLGQFANLKKTWEIIKYYCFKSLNFEVVWYEDNTYNLLERSSWRSSIPHILILVKKGIFMFCHFFAKWSESCSVISDSLWLHGLYICSPWNSPGQNTRMGRHSLLQGIFLTQELNPGLPHCRLILYQLSQEGSPFIAKPLFKYSPNKFWLHKFIRQYLF